ncbi:conserved hypothetical protein [Ricinus communis]|uniref:Reverse transcriptase zinc-binding domain-containing protein n=1 Tax=Ricinus communis TaxID=3988 RepID=B9RGJ2_RICCO|nr:conserved hypothetical protein [Ricinus communis]
MLEGMKLLKEGLRSFGLRGPKDDTYKVADLMRNDGQYWNERKVQSICSPNDARAILKIPITRKRRPNQWVWHFTPNGVCIMKGEAERVHRNSSSMVQPKIWKYIRSSKSPPKIVNFIWRVMVNALPIKDNMYKKKLGQDPFAFFYLHAKATWFLSHWGYQSLKMGFTTFGDWWSAVNEGLGRSDSRVTTSQIAITCWNIWKVRNCAVFEKKELKPQSTVALIRKDIKTLDEVIRPQQEDQSLETRSLTQSNNV